VADRGTVSYLYDGSFRGLLCCFAAAKEAGSIPFAVMRNDAAGLVFGERREIKKESRLAEQAGALVVESMGEGALRLAREAFYADRAGKELAVLQFFFFGLERGRAALSLLADARVAPVWEAARAYGRELEHYRGFVRFAEHQGALFAAIRPRAFILAALGAHFRARLAREDFLIYDLGRKIAFAYAKGRAGLFPAAEFTPPPVEAGEAFYQELWRLFFHRVAIPERKNTRCQNNLIPKRYREGMTEFEEGGLKTNRCVNLSSSEK
jgi:probable DNA metabolism protein